MKENFTFLRNNYRTFFPVKIFFIIIGVWLVLATLNFLSLKYWKFTGADIFFPFSVIYPSSFLWTGFLFALLFLFFGVYIYRKSENLSFTKIIFSCIALVLFGNLAQGNLDVAFEQPFYLKGRQYYHDAINIKDGYEWLRTFTIHQDSYQLHTKTHPPFVVLLHYVLLNIFKGNILLLGISFFVIASLFFVVLKNIFIHLDFETERAKKLLLLTAVIPSVNIYLLVSIDGLILMTSSLMILGLTRILKIGKLDFWSLFWCSISVLFTNMLSFSGLFLLAFSGIFGLIYFFKKRYDFMILLIFVLIINTIIFLSFYYGLGYNHLLTFHQASSSENPDGFMLFSKPYIYLWTRLQAIGEILMFLSLGLSAVFLSVNHYNKVLFSDIRINNLFFSAISALGLMFISGAYGTGETARACLFIVPFFILLLKNIKTETFLILYFLSLLQTFGMQMIGNYFW